MTSVLSTAGPLYLRDELAMERWYRSRWKPQDYQKIRRFRSATRGLYHLGWIARALRRGRIGEALSRSGGLMDSIRSTGLFGDALFAS
jgi:hypothetical protein